MNAYHDECLAAKTAALKASEVVMAYYQKLSDTRVEVKADKSFVTEADRASHRVIEQYLTTAFDYPILSEEADCPEGYREADRLWVVDPLDGTRNFLAADGAFVINIALLDKGRPVVGVMMAPAHDKLYFAAKGEGAYCQSGEGLARLSVSPTDTLAPSSWLVSRFHVKKEAVNWLSDQGVRDIRSMGSALKYCSIAEALADGSFRMTPLMEWDICAADCLLHEAGGRLTDFQGRPLRYQREDPRMEEGILATNGHLHAVLVEALQDAVS